MKRLVTSAVLLLATTVFAQIQDRGLEKSVDEFTGTVLCEQWVVNLADPGRLTLRTILDERGVITFSLIRSTATSGVINIPWAWTEQKGVLLRFADGEVRGLYVENTHYDGNNQYANLIVTSGFLEELLAETEDLRFRLVDWDEGDNRQHYDGTLTVVQLAPLRSFLEECIGNL